MTAIERTAYPTFARAPQLRELLTLYTPTPEDVAFVSTTARGPNQKFALMILLKVFQKLGYFPTPQHIPSVIISHIRGEMKLPEDLVPDITPRTLYKYHATIHKHLKINGDIKHIRRVALKAISEVVLVMDDPADLINVAIETLVKENGVCGAMEQKSGLGESGKKRIKYNKIYALYLSILRLNEACQKISNLAKVV